MENVKKLNSEAQGELCQACQLKFQKVEATKQVASLTQEEKEAYWKVIDYFYEDQNPFSYQFTANNVNVDVANIVLKMVDEFATCAKRVAPFEFIAIIMSLVDAVFSGKIMDILILLYSLTGAGKVPFTTCRVVQAAGNRTPLYLAFAGI